jgi:8-oxo-dGTP pyrophosphatase MutT (NUDIX family)
LDAAALRARLGAHAAQPVEHGRNRRAAVLVPIEPGGGVWLTRRAATLSSHAGQVAFPGGKIDSGDASPEAAALREAEEETGLDRRLVELLGRMDDHVTGTGFHITPVTALVPAAPHFIPAASEVVAVFRLGFDVLLNPHAPERRRALYKGIVRDFFVWPHPDHVIWGATADMLVQLARILRGETDLAQPFHRSPRSTEPSMAPPA